MILKEIRSSAAWSFTLSFHPNITFVDGLGPERRARMAAMIAAILRGDLVSLSAVASINDLDMPFTPNLAAELELPDSGVSPVLREQDLPGAVIVEEYPKPEEVKNEREEPTDEELKAHVLAELPDPEFVSPETEES